LTPRGSATVRRTKTLTCTGNSLALELQRGVNSISSQCILWPVACTEWGTCLTSSKFGVLGANDPWIETFRKFVSSVCVSTTIHVPWPNLVKIGRCEVTEKSSRSYCLQKKPGVGDTFELPISPRLADRAQNFVNVVGAWPVHVYPLWSGSAVLAYNNNNQKL